MKCVNYCILPQQIRVSTLKLGHFISDFKSNFQNCNVHYELKIGRACTIFINLRKKNWYFFLASPKYWERWTPLIVFQRQQNYHVKRHINTFIVYFMLGRACHLFIFYVFVASEEGEEEEESMPKSQKRPLVHLSNLCSRSNASVILK